MKNTTPPSKAADKRPLTPHYLLRCHLAHLRARAYADGTIRNTALYLGNFLDWLGTRRMRSLRRIRRRHFDHYQRFLHAYRKRDGQPLAVMGQHVRLITIQGFFRWLTRQGYLPTNHAADLDLPRLGIRLPLRWTPLVGQEGREIKI